MPECGAAAVGGGPSKDLRLDVEERAAGTKILAIYGGDAVTGPEPIR